MAEGIDLPPLARGTLPAEAERLARLDAATPQILAALDGELDAVALEATLVCLLWEAMPWANWVGFYRRTGERLLTVGPYQGTMGCLRIEFERGVCGACARTGEVQIVDDVHTRPDHIACDARTRSELVLPVRDADGALQAVLDLDATHLAAFSRAEADRLATLVAATLGKRGVRF